MSARGYTSARDAAAAIRNAPNAWISSGREHLKDFSAPMHIVKGLLAELDALRADLARVTAERDEARDNAIGARAERDAAIKERHEALAETRSLRAGLTSAVRERAEALSALADIVATQPKCDECDAPATRAFRRGEGRWCDDHGERWLAGYKHPVPAPEYPRAKALRRAVAMLAERLSAEKQR